jgi:hypothetical protein
MGPDAAVVVLLLRASLLLGSTVLQAPNRKEFVRGVKRGGVRLGFCKPKATLTNCR